MLHAESDFDTSVLGVVPMEELGANLIIHFLYIPVPVDSNEYSEPYFHMEYVISQEQSK